jgi:hypothetical protein
VIVGVPHSIPWQHNPSKKRKTMKTPQTKYAVGYARPPKAHQFRPGQSGNPSGRPKGSRSFISDLRDELAELVAISDGAKEIQITKQQAIVKMLLAKAIAGDPRAIATVVGSCVRSLAEDDGADGAEAPEDQAIMKALSQPSRRETVAAKRTSTEVEK